MPYAAVNGKLYIKTCNLADLSPSASHSTYIQKDISTSKSVGNLKRIFQYCVNQLIFNSFTTNILH